MNPKHREKYLADLAARIEKFGWVVQSVFPTEDDQSPGFAYTVGLYDHGLPELIVFALPTEVGHQLLNDLAADQVLRKSLGQPLSGPRSHAGWPMAMHLLEAKTALAQEFATVAHMRSLGQASVLQVVWPDPKGVLPWEPSFDKMFEAYQPLLGPAPTPAAIANLKR